MSQKRLACPSILAISGALIAFFALLFNAGGSKDRLWHLIQPDLVYENKRLSETNQNLARQIEGLEKQNLSLKTVLKACESGSLAVKAAAGDCNRVQSMLPLVDEPSGVAQERFEIRLLYRQMRAEKSRWDRYQQQQYKNILEDTVEPLDIESRDLDLDHEGNLEHFLELESALKRHKRLIRDIRVFHDEIKFQKKQLSAQRPYALYDLKFELAPFARESALVDALQQAMSALSAGIYVQEAAAVMDRFGDEFTRPIQQLYEQRLENTEASVELNYNYNFYTVFGKKLMDYADSLARQSAITLGPSAFGELDFFSRRLSDSLYDLYLIGLYEAVDPNRLDVNELEQILHVRQ